MAPGDNLGAVGGWEGDNLRVGDMKGGKGNGRKHGRGQTKGRRLLKGQYD